MIPRGPGRNGRAMWPVCPSPASQGLVTETRVKCSEGSCSSRKKCFDGSNRSASSNVPTWKCVSLGNFTLSQVSVEPQVWQKPRVVPGEDLNLVSHPLCELRTFPKARQIFVSVSTARPKTNYTHLAPRRRTQTIETLADKFRTDFAAP